MRPREAGRYEITHVPASIRARDRQITGKDGRSREPVLQRYERICFDKHHIRLRERVNAPKASLVHSGHPLMRVITDLVLEQHRGRLKEGAILIDLNDTGLIPRVLFIIDHSIKEGGQPEHQKVVSRRVQFVGIDAAGHTNDAGYAPHLALEPIGSEDLALVQDVLNAPWLTQNLEQQALAYASQKLVPDHFHEIRTHREQRVERILAAVHERLTKEISHWSDRYIKLTEEVAAGRQPHLQPDNAQRQVEELTVRLTTRRKELDAMRHVVSSTPVIVGGALIIPAGLLAQRKGSGEFCADAAARARIEALAMQAVMATERALGHQVVDVSAEKCGWDITAIPPAQDGKVPLSRHIEVKGRAAGQNTVTVTCNEVRYGLNQADKFILAIVLVDGERVDGPYYIRQPFAHEPDWAETSKTLDLAQLLTRAKKPLALTR